MQTAALLKLYEERVRRNPGQTALARVERRNGLVLVRQRYVFVSWWDFPPDEADETIRTLIEDVRAPGQAVIWRIYDDDGPADPPHHLAAHGCIQHPPGQLMVLDLANELPPHRATDIRKVETADDYRTWSRINNAGFGSNFPCDDAEVRMALSDTSRPLYTAHENGTPLASACLWAPEDRTFCGLQGGAVLAEARGRGLYRDLTLHRLHLARALGYRYAAVDANANSGPRLEGMGFAPVTGETTWTLDMPA